MRERLFDAGRTLMMLPPAYGPKKYGSSWPDTVKEFWESYGLHSAEAPWPRATGFQIDRFDEAIMWPLLVEDILTRRVIGYRMITHPITRNQIWTWRRIARKAEIEWPYARTLFNDGVRIISNRLNKLGPLYDEKEI